MLVPTDIVPLENFFPSLNQFNVAQRQAQCVYRESQNWAPMSVNIVFFTVIIKALLFKAILMTREKMSLSYRLVHNKVDFFFIFFFFKLALPLKVIISCNVDTALGINSSCQKMI